MAYLATSEPGLVAKLMESFGPEKGLRSLADQLDADPDFGIDVTNSGLLFACEGLAASSSTGTSTVQRAARRARARSATAANAVANEPDPLAAQAFNLSSRSASAKKIWLDFDGCILTGTSWNNDNYPVITIPPYDKDGINTTFNSEERSDIVAMWRAVAEDYAPFDVDVTTIPPGATIESRYIFRACIGGDGTGTGLEQYGAAGWSRLNTFGEANPPPVLIFSQKNYNIPKYVWEAISHELGHTFGLSHDGDAVSGVYSRGWGDWAPIMGVGYERPLSQWSKGDYSGATNPEDDTFILASKLGRAPSLIGTSLATATLLATASDGTASAAGVVAQANVADVFRFYATGGTASITGQVLADWADLWNVAYGGAAFPIPITISFPKPRPTADNGHLSRTANAYQQRQWLQVHSKSHSETRWH
ncbi:hypothetical protein OEZ86_012174 [Tetradesmus obliquus]|nr:hypothetical protein OEZ86_012174 [Tetradesmus obliquus]